MPVPNLDTPSTFRLARLRGEPFARELHKFLAYIEAIVESGTIGPQGPQGAAGATGAQGVAGPQGTTGAQGPIGATGAQGSVGATGAQGLEGAQGATGPAPWTFIGAYDNGASYNLGDAVAYQGGFYYRTGNPLNPGYPPTPGSISASWTPVADGGAQGPQGAQGDAGPQGAEGPQGFQGFQGDQGPQGPQGDVGPQGPQGFQGDAGAQGATGAQGVQGAVGAQGVTGATGAQGAVGAQGAIGYPVTAVYGAFSDSSDQPFVPGSVLVAKFNTTEIANGVSVVNDPVTSRPTRLTVASAGVYSFCVSPQILHTGGGAETMTFWARVNGTNLPNSASSLEMGNNNNRTLPFVELVLTLTAGQYVEWAFYASSGTNLSLEQFPAVAGPPAIPAIPSVIATVKLLGS